ncbi:MULTISPECIES: ATP-binding protein [Streptomyces]|uniref:Uncharacterized protein n=1 Tax=Streptomyces pseudovenezuelae TaxID=67350 RepID=A0A117PQJ3_9ACTN|nr:MULTISPECIES: hypothetical protein [Streptomyces]KUM86077.1 hypothetical protein AQI94_23855 [Streptomyces pseudovenezuelae]
MTEWDRPLSSIVAWADENATVYQAGRDMIIPQVTPPWRINKLFLENRISLSAAAQGRQQPSKLLRTRDEVVDFSGRSDEEEDFATWRDRDEDVLLRLLHAPGGEGKTRFARHLARTWGEAGWIALEAQHTKNSAPDMRSAPVVGEDATGVLVIVDYAERWPEHDLSEFIRQSLELWKLPLRILLLSRPAGAWWEQLEYSLDRDLDLVAEAVRLPPLGARLEDRERAFLEARNAFAARLKVSELEAVNPPPGLLSDPAYSLILTIHMAALAAVDAYHQKTSAPVDPARLSSYLLKRERDHWQNLERRKRLRTDAEALESAVYAASLCGPLRRREAYEIAVLMGTASNNERARKIVEDHAFCYPSPSVLREEEDVLEPLQPDRLAEDFVALTLPGHGAEFTGQRWMAEATDQLLKSSSEDDSRSVRAALTTLIEMAPRWRHISVDYLSPLLKARPRIVLECGNASLATLANNPHIELGTLRIVAETLRSHQHKGLGTGAAAILARVTKARLQEVEDPAEQATLCHELTAIYQLAGLFDQAAETAHQEIALLRPLAEAGSDSHSAALADALFSLCAALTEQGSHKEAAQAGAEALKIKDSLSVGGAPDDSRPTAPERSAGTFGTALSASLVHHAEWLFYESGDLRALMICDEAVSRLRRVSEWGPNRRVYLARALHSQASFLLGMADVEAAWRTAAQSISEWRKLFAEKRSVHCAERLVQALALMSTVQVRKGHTRAAIDSASEAVSLARKVRDADKRRTVPLAEALAVLGDTMAHESPIKALTVSSESLRLYRSLARKEPRHREALAVALAKHTTILLKCGRVTTALPLSLESVTLTGTEANTRVPVPGDKTVLALVLGARADALKMAGDHDQALTLARQAAEASEELAQRLPWFAPDLAERQSRIADILLAKGELSNSVTMSLIALRTYAHFRQIYAPLPWLDVRLTTSYVRALVAVGDLRRSARGIRRLGSTLREIGGTEGVETAVFLALLALHQWAANHREEAAASARNAVRLYQARGAERPGVRLELATVLEMKGKMSVEQGHSESGLRDLITANTLLTELRKNGHENPSLVPFQVRCLTSLGSAYHALARDQEARAATREAVSLIRTDELSATPLEIAVDAHITFARIRLERRAHLSEVAPVVRAAQHMCTAAGATSGLAKQEAELTDLMRRLTK